MRRSHNCWRVGAVGVGGLLLASGGQALGATLSSESSVGLTGEYNSNPYLVKANGAAAEGAAVLAEIPATYSSDWQSLELEPRLRYAETHGAAQLLSDYQYLDAIWRLNGERNGLSVDAAWHRDSTLYNVYENSALAGHDLPRLEDSVTVSWHRALSERSDVQLAGSWDHVAYSATSDLRLDNYGSAQASASYERSVTERWQWSTSVGFQHFEQPALGSRSDDKFFQTSLTGALSERWSLTAQGGYSRLNSSAVGYQCCAIVQGPDGSLLQYIAVQQDSSGGSVNYLLNLQRTSERLVLAISASQAIQPSGLGAALKSDLVNLSVTMRWNERLTFTATAQAAQQSNPLQRADIAGSRRYYNGALGANWLWREHWTLTAQAVYAQQRSSTSEGSGTTVNVTLSRQFGRLTL